MAKIDIEKFIVSLIDYAEQDGMTLMYDYLTSSLLDQELTYKDREIVEINKPLWIEEAKRCRHDALEKATQSSNQNTIKPDSIYGGWTVNTSIANSIEGD